jgi:Flp pilus assembly protein TadD
MSVRELKSFLDVRGVDHSKCVEKSDLRALAEECATVPAEADEECAICLDALQQPQTMPCGHRFCLDCVHGMQRHGVAKEQLCPLCRGPMPDAARLHQDAVRLLGQYDRWSGSEASIHNADNCDWKRASIPQPPWVQALLSKATALCEKVLAIDPKADNAHYALGYALQRSGDIRGAIAAFRACVALKPQHDDAYVHLGGLLFEGGDAAGAEAALRAAAAAKPTSVTALCDLSNVLSSRGATAEALSILHATTAAFPRCAHAHTQLGLLLDAKFGDPTGAGVAWRAAVSADPQWSTAHYSLGHLHLENGDTASAEAAFRAAAAADPSNASAHVNVAWILSQRGDWLGAEAPLRGALAADPQHLKARALLSQSLRVRGDEAGAEAVDPSACALLEFFTSAALEK